MDIVAGLFLSGSTEMLFGEPETLRFLAAVDRLKRLLQRKERRTRRARLKLRRVLANLQAG
jgi:hypothetical protein